MTTVTEGDLRELKDLISTRFNELDKKLDVHIAKTDEQLKGIDRRLDGIDRRIDDTNKRIDGVDGRIGETNARINTLTLGFLSIVGVLVAGILGKVTFFPSV